VRVIGLLVLAAVLDTATVAQKTPDPEARNKRAVSVAPARTSNSVKPHRSRSDTPSVPRSGSSSARELAKIEGTSVQQIKATHKKSASSKPGNQAVPATQPQTKSKPMKFSYHAPSPADKISAKNPSPAPVRSRPEKN
jgi:hypothetical protein